MEVKIEHVDMQHCSNATSSTTASSSRPSPHFMGEGHSSEGMPISRSGSGMGKGFNEEKQKFIMEAQSWSKQVDSEIAKKMKGEPSLSSSLIPPPSSSSVGGAYPLGLLAQSQLVGTQSSLSSKFSAEEQEKFLRQHFEQIIQQQHLLSAAGCPPMALPIASPAKSPLGGSSLSNSTAAAGNGATHSRHQSTVPAGTVTPLGHAPSQPHSSSGSNPSPKKTSPLNFFQAPPHSTSTPVSMFPFLGQTGSAANTAAAASFLCNPSLSQYPIAAAMFNPVYQAALQQLMTAQQVQGGNTPIIPDPALLQGLIDKVPLVLPDGRIAFVNMGSLAQQGNGETSPAKESKKEVDKEEEQEERNEGEEVLRSPHNVTSGCKRMRSPGVDVRSEFRATPPKRRRSSSLPDITQLLQISPHKKKLGEGGDRESGRMEERRTERKSNGMTTGVTLSDNSPRARQHAPPTMIHIPQDVKVNDPMLGFPTPPQSSPLMGGFALSPIVLPSSSYHSPHHHQQHQPMTPVTPGQDPLHTAEELRELVEAGELQTTLPPSPEGSNLPPFPAGRGPIQLWQFLLDLLLSPDKQHMIHWTGNGYEFCILQPEDIAKLWGARKNKPRMNYDKLSRGLRYYYNKGIMDKVQGKKLTFKYTCDVHNYIRSRNAQAHGASTPRPGSEYRSGSSTPIPLPPMGDGGQEGDDIGDNGGMIGGERGRLYGSGSINEIELIQPPGFQHTLKKTTEAMGEMAAVVNFPGLMGVVKGCGLHGVVDQDSRGTASTRTGGSLCSEAV